MTLINGITQENVHQMKEAEYIEYTMELIRFNYEDEVETYHQIASHTYPIQKAQIQQLEQMNIQLCKEYIMSCDDKWCSECYALSIFLSSKNDQEEIEFGEHKTEEETTNASHIAFGAILSQLDENGQEQVIVYVSRILKPTELKYGLTELKAAAVIWALKHF
ncbi:hypothetical protein G9A89_018222 [Geosiphon pyriformis]|nr:hypothetical protein G9A89_018222 [Geosiphon pyriformis]